MHAEVDHFGIETDAGRGAHSEVPYGFFDRVLRALRGRGNIILRVHKVRSERERHG